MSYQILYLYMFTSAMKMVSCFRPLVFLQGIQKSLYIFQLSFLKSLTSRCPSFHSQFHKYLGKGPCYFAVATVEDIILVTSLALETSNDTGKNYINILDILYIEDQLEDICINKIQTVCGSWQSLFRFCFVLCRNIRILSVHLNTNIAFSPFVESVIHITYILLLKLFRIVIFPFHKKTFFQRKKEVYIYVLIFFRIVLPSPIFVCIFFT